MQHSPVLVAVTPYELWVAEKKVVETMRSRTANDNDLWENVVRRETIAKCPIQWIMVGSVGAKLSQKT